MPICASSLRMFSEATFEYRSEVRADPSGPAAERRSYKHDLLSGLAEPQWDRRILPWRFLGVFHALQPTGWINPGLGPICRFPTEP
jgi:hypothetical protein